MDKSYQNSEPIHPALPAAAIPRRRDGYRLGKIPCCAVLQDENCQNILVLNDSGALIWRLCNGDIDVGGMIDMIDASFHDSRDSVARDVYRSLDTFRTYDLIEIDGA